jgi:signal transduction histidine kinase/DNA-binding response OmpR family regulator
MIPFSPTSLFGRACAWLEARKRMFYQFRHRIIGPLALFWLVITIASLVMGAIAWNRLDRNIGPSAEMDQATHRAMASMQRMTWIAGILGIGAGLFALYLYRVDYLQERAQRELLEEKLQAEAAVKEKSAFLANMSHEIRSPMNAILGFSELLEPEGLTPRQSQYVRAIRDNGASLLQLINDILDLSKLEAGKLELHPDPTDMRDSCEFLRTIFAQQALKKSLQLQFELSPDLPRALLLDRLRLRQVLVNLLGNAIKFTEHGQVKTSVSWQKQNSGGNGTLLIDVADTGIGIPPEKLQVVFEPFVQADSRRTAEKQGTGIGLTIVKRLTEMMKGTLTVESAVGKGTTFHLRFPEVPVSVRLPVGDHAEPGGAVDFDDFAPATLLVVDDHETNRDLIAGMFVKTHHQLRFATNGKEALESLERFKADIVLLDIRMPVMDGRTVLKEIRKRAALSSLPVIAVTASSDASEDGDLRHQFNGYIRKPFSRQTLFLTLAQFLQQEASLSPSERQHPRETVAFFPAPGRRVEQEALALELRRLEAAEWPVLCDSLAVNETRFFAHKLFALGHAARCEPLTAYAATLATFADAYAISELERQLDEFPGLVESLELSLNQPLIA